MGIKAYDANTMSIMFILLPKSNTIMSHDTTFLHLPYVLRPSSLPSVYTSLIFILVLLMWLLKVSFPLEDLGATLLPPMLLLLAYWVLSIIEISKPTLRNKN